MNCDTPTRWRYSNGTCRCDACKRLHADRMREYKHRTGKCRTRADYLAEIRKTPPAHGTESRYTDHRCRCDDCRHAATEARRNRRHRAVTSEPDATIHTG